MSEELTKEEKQRIKEERRKAFEAAHPELAARRKAADEKKNQLRQKVEKTLENLEELSLNDQQAARRAKMEDLRRQGIDPFGQAYEQSDHVADLRARCGSMTAEELEEADITVSAAGRILAKRRMGKLGFVTLLDRSGRIQVIVNQRIVGDEIYELFKQADLGDIIGIKGRMVKTKTGELSIEAREYTHLSNGLRNFH